MSMGTKTAMDHLESRVRTLEGLVEILDAKIKNDEKMIREILDYLENTPESLSESTPRMSGSLGSGTETGDFRPTTETPGDSPLKSTPVEPTGKIGPNTDESSGEE